jgi:hypothetical protein
MEKSGAFVSRRGAVIGGGVAVATGLVFRYATEAEAQGAIQSGGGIAGGGSVTLPSGATANFSVFGSQFAVDGRETPLFFGNLWWSDSDGTTIVATEITRYGPVDDSETDRELMGLATVNDTADRPFTLILSAPRPEEPYSLHLTVQSGAESSTPTAQVLGYDVEAPLETGDIQLLRFDFPA